MIDSWASRMLRALTLAACFALGAAFAQSPASAPSGAQLPAEMFYRHPDIASAALSPSGRWLAVRTRHGGERLGIMTFDLQDKGKALETVRFADADIRDIYWVNDDRLIFDLVDLEGGSGSQRFAPGLYSVRPDGSELFQLIRSYDKGYVSRTRQIREPLNWNHTLLEVPIGNGREVIVGEEILDGAGDLVSVRAKRLNVENGSTSSLAFGAPPNARGWWFDPAGEPRVVVASDGAYRTINWRAPGKDDWVQIARYEYLRAPFYPFFVDSAGVLYVTTPDGPAQTNVLRRFDFAAGKPSADKLASTPGFDFRGAVVVDPISGKAVGVRLETDAETTAWFDPRMKALQAKVDARLQGSINRVSCRRCNEPDAIVLVFSYSDRDPGRYWIYRPDGEQWKFAGAARDDIDPAKMATLDFQRIKARDGGDLPLWLTTPAKSARASAPPAAVVLVHGGPWVRGGHWQWDADAQFLASRGYAVIEPEFRGSTGYGEAHFRAGWKQWGGPMQDDVADAVKWAADKGLIDPKRVCIAGASYGGYAALMGLARYPDLYRCGIAWVAVTDPRLMFSSSWLNDIDEESKKYDLRTLIGDPDKDAAMLKAAAPVELAARIKAPVLLAFGGEDRRVPLEHGTLMRDALRAAGNDPEWVVYPDEGHGWLRIETRIDFANRVERFLARNLK
ncbi:MAG TPA: prolyl oligopeptidase family serine peptidase [Burkholderiaceae bacterium]|nr:prolyl oligopeptidase family serine peptidase [Burkholderiaceae bacterium]